MITKEHALRIKKKLKGKFNKGKKNRSHDLIAIYYEDKLVAQFGLRRGSDKHLPHDHIPESLYLRPGECLKLAQCAMSREQWYQRMKAIGRITDQ